MTNSGPTSSSFNTLNTSHKQFGETEHDTPFWIPTNCAIRIFSFLSRDELDKARLVSRTWNSLITGVGRRHFKKRFIHAVEISSNFEYTVRVYYQKRIKSLTFKKYFCYCDLCSVEDRADFRIIGSPHYDYSCTHFFHGYTKLNKHFKFSTRTVTFREKICNHKKLQVYKGRIIYKSKIFTPPLDFYVRLKWLLENAQVKYLVFVDFAFTELFVDKFEQYLGATFPVEKLFIHNCSLKHISPETFHRFIGHIVLANEYHLELIKNGLPNHVNDALLLTPNLLRANVFLVSGTTARRSQQLQNFNNVNAGILYFKITKEGFKDFLSKRQGLHKEKVSTAFGIQHTLMNEMEVIEDYKQDYKQNGGSHYFKLVVFGSHKFVALDGEFVDDEEEFFDVDPEQRLQLVRRSVFENNNLKDYLNFDMFKPSQPIVL